MGKLAHNVFSTLNGIIDFMAEILPHEWDNWDVHMTVCGNMPSGYS